MLCEVAWGGLLHGHRSEAGAGVLSIPQVSLTVPAPRGAAGRTVQLSDPSSVLLQAWPSLCQAFLFSGELLFHLIRVSLPL